MNGNVVGSWTSTVLICDEEFAFVKLVRIHLARRSCRVILATTFEEVVFLGQQEHPDAMVLDFIQPHIDGPALVKAIRAADGLLYTPIIVLSSDLEEFDYRSVLPCDVSAVLLKPIEVGLLLLTLQQFVVL